MLGKLLKHEMKSYRFSMGITFLTGLVFTIFMKLLCMLPYQRDAKAMIQVLSFYGYYYLIMLIAFAAQILIVVRFYKTTVGDRGYLTWTLPVKTSSVLWSKLIAAEIWYMISGIVVVILLILFFAGGYWADEMMIFGNDAIEMFSVVLGEIGSYFEIQYLIPILLFVLSGILWSLAGFIIMYMCIAIGQLFGKWRILGSIGAYFLVIIAMEVIAIVFLTIASVSGIFMMEELVDVDAFLVITGVLAFILLVGIGVFAGVFAITNYIFKNRLNLE